MKPHPFQQSPRAAVTFLAVLALVIWAITYGKTLSDKKKTEAELKQVQMDLARYTAILQQAKRASYEHARMLQRAKPDYEKLVVQRQELEKKLGLEASAPAETWPKLPAPEPAKPPPPIKISSKVRVDFLPDKRSENIAGFIYVDTDGTPGAERAVLIRKDRAWTLSKQSRPGLYDRKIAAGKISKNGDLKNFPKDAFQGATKVWKAGYIRAYAGETELPELR